MKRARVITSILLSGMVLMGAPALAQSGDTRQAFQARFGWFFPSGGGDLWDENESVFTLSHSDFDSFRFGMSYVGSFTNHFEIGFNLDFYDKTVLSAYRDYVDELGFSILHDTQLNTAPMTVDIRVLPGGRYRKRPQGRSVLHPVFYFGGGAGINFWEYEERGDFLDFGFDPPEIFSDRYVDDGEALTVHVLAGVELPISPRFNVVFEVRHSWSDDTLGGRFAGLGTIELGGTAAFVGSSFRF